MPIGTLIEIAQVVSEFNGENGRDWIVWGVIQNGEFAQRRVLLPHGGGVPPAIFDWDFLERANSAAESLRPVHVPASSP